MKGKRIFQWSRARVRGQKIKHIGRDEGLEIEIAVGRRDQEGETRNWINANQERSSERREYPEWQRGHRG